MTDETKIDFPFEDVAARANALLEMDSGIDVFFKWTCRACGERCAFDKPNELYTRGQHEGCPVSPGFVTDLKLHGCNFVVFVVAKGGTPVRDIVAARNAQEEEER